MPSTLPLRAVLAVDNILVRVLPPIQPCRPVSFFPSRKAYEKRFYNILWNYVRHFFGQFSALPCPEVYFFCVALVYLYSVIPFPQIYLWFANFLSPSPNAFQGIVVYNGQLSVPCISCSVNSFKLIYLKQFFSLFNKISVTGNVIWFSNKWL